MDLFVQFVSANLGQLHWCLVSPCSIVPSVDSVGERKREKDGRPSDSAELNTVLVIDFVLWPRNYLLACFDLFALDRDRALSFRNDDRNWFAMPLDGRKNCSARFVGTYSIGHRSFGYHNTHPVSNGSIQSLCVLRPSLVGAGFTCWYESIESNLFFFFFDWLVIHETTCWPSIGICRALAAACIRLLVWFHTCCY